MLGWAARALSVAWAGFWLWFGVASAVAEKQPWDGILLYAARPGLIFCALALIAWCRPKWGGVLLVAAGCIVAVLYLLYFGHLPLIVRLGTLTMLTLPPVISGIVLVRRSADQSL